MAKEVLVGVTKDAVVMKYIQVRPVGAYLKALFCDGVEARPAFIQAQVASALGDAVNLVGGLAFRVVGEAGDGGSGGEGG